MKFNLVLTCTALLLALFWSPLSAKEIPEYRTEADQYYAEQNYKKAYKIYYKLAKMGDHRSQDQLAVMFSRGEGKDQSFEEAYAWSILAAEGGEDRLTLQSDELLSQAGDKAKAEKRAAKLMKKYSVEALQEKAERHEARRRSHEMGGCTGSKTGCSGR